MHRFPSSIYQNKSFMGSCLHARFSAWFCTRNILAGKSNRKSQHFANHLLCHRNLNCKNISIGHLCPYDDSNPPQKHSYIILLLPSFCSFVIKQFSSPNQPMKDEKYTIIYGLNPKNDWLIVAYILQAKFVGGWSIMVFENHRKSLIQYCERSELGLHSWVDKSSLKMPKIGEKWDILGNFQTMCWSLWSSLILTNAVGTLIT